MAVHGALILKVTEQSPADDAGFVSGCRITAVDGHPLRDMIDWGWYTSEDTIMLSYIDIEGESGVVELEREPGEEWGFVFDGVVFESVKVCKNNCTFCFMRQLPDDVRPSLSLRDDDFRLSFFDGTFVTFTNLSYDDERRIIEQRISPLRMSLHAITPEIRKELIGPYEARGIEACESLLDAGIELHMQIVLLPEVNDREELRRTLEWAYKKRGVAGVGVVPLGFTKHQTRFKKSFNRPEAAQEVLRIIGDIQKKALLEKGTPWVFAADEFYRNAYPKTLLEMLPPTKHYGEFSMFEDGIGIVRSTVDSWQESGPVIEALADRLKALGRVVHHVVGCAQIEFINPLIDMSPLKGYLIPYPVKNEYFGGNVDVTGLLTGIDIVTSLNDSFRKGEGIELAIIPRIIFNADGVTLDDMSLEDMQRASSVPLAVVSCNPSEYLSEIITLLD